MTAAYKALCEVEDVFSMKIRLDHIASEDNDIADKLSHAMCEEAAHAWLSRYPNEEIVWLNWEDKAQGHPDTFKQFFDKHLVRIRTAYDSLQRVSEGQWESYRSELQ